MSKDDNEGGGLICLFIILILVFLLLIAYWYITIPILILLIVLVYVIKKDTRIVYKYINKYKEQPIERICGLCQSVIDRDDANFCPYCGVKL